MDSKPKETWSFKFDPVVVRKKMNGVIQELGKVELMLQNGYTYNNIDNRIVLDMVRVCRSMTAQLRERLNNEPGPEGR